VIALRNIAALALLVCAAGCVSGLDKAKQSVTVAAKVYSVGADELVSADDAVKASLQAKYDAGQVTQEQATSQFKDWVVKRTKVALALTELKRAVALAGLGISAVEAGQAKDYASVLADLAKAVSEALGALSAAGVKIL
jgi:hypothetical protein